MTKKIVKNTKNSEENSDKGKERRLKNLKPFVKGDPRINKHGTPRGKRLATLIREELERVVAVNRDGTEFSNNDMIIKKHTEKAKSGDHKSTEILWERLEGKPGQEIKVEHSGEIQTTTKTLSKADLAAKKAYERGYFDNREA